MGKGKRVLAILGIVLLVAAVASPMFGAFGSANLFRATLALAIMVPIMAYVIMLIYKVLGGGRRMPDTKIKNIVFDVGNVLVAFDWEGYLESFHFPPQENEVMIQKVFHSGIWNERDRGLLTEQEYIEQFVAGAPKEYEADIRRVMADSDKTIRPLDYADAWTAYLRSKGYRLYILSNYCTDVLAKTKPMMTFLRNMDGELWSCDVKQIKPEREIYLSLLNKYQLKPEECVFIDDRAENCEGARKVGMEAIQFQSLDQVAGELEKLGIA